MRSHAMKLALAASLMLGGAAGSTERDPIATGSTSSAGSSGKHDTGGALGGVTADRAGFGFSPFLEEGLVRELRPARNGELRPPVPTFRRDFGRLAEP